MCHMSSKVERERERGINKKSRDSVSWVQMLYYIAGLSYFPKHPEGQSRNLSAEESEIRKNAAPGKGKKMHGDQAGLGRRKVGCLTVTGTS